MSNGEINPSDRRVVIELAREFDRIINSLREAALAADQQAAKGSSGAFAMLSSILVELRSLSSRTSSPNVASFRSDVGTDVSGASVLALSHCDQQQLTELLDAADAAVQQWRPTEHTADQRPDLVFGTREEVAAAWQEVAEDQHAAERDQRLRIEATVRSLVEFLDRARRNIDQAIPEPAHRYSISRRPSGSYLVRFEVEIGELNGEAIDRLVFLFRHVRSDVESVAVDYASLAASRSVTDQNNGSGPSREQALANAMGREDFGQLRREIHERLEEIELRLSDGASTEELEQLEDDRDRLNTYRNGLWRVPDSEIRTMRNRVERGWRRLADHCQSNMPVFAEHIRSSWSYDLRLDQYVYEGVEWRFEDC